MRPTPRTWRLSKAGKWVTDTDEVTSRSGTLEIQQLTHGGPYQLNMRLAGPGKLLANHDDLEAAKEDYVTRRRQAIMDFEAGLKLIERNWPFLKAVSHDKNSQGDQSAAQAFEAAAHHPDRPLKLMYTFDVVGRRKNYTFGFMHKAGVRYDVALFYARDASEDPLVRPALPGEQAIHSLLAQLQALHDLQLGG